MSGSALTTGQQLLERTGELQQALEKQLPGYKDLLRVIHNMLKSDEDLVHVLKEEDIGVIISALSKHTGIVITTSQKKAGKTASGKKLNEVTAEDI